MSRKVSKGKRISVGRRTIMRLRTTPAICLPKEFLSANNLDFGDEVAIIFNHILKVVAMPEESGEPN